MQPSAARSLGEKWGSTGIKLEVGENFCLATVIVVEVAASV